MPNGISHPYQLDDSISSLRVIVQYVSSPFKYLKYIHRPRSVASDLVLCCLPMTYKKD